MAMLQKGLQLGLNAIQTWGPSLIKGTFNMGKGAFRFAAKNPKFSFIGGGIAVGSYTGNGALRTWANWVGGGDSKETAAEKLNRVINGDKAQGGNVIGNTIDSVAGEGTAQEIADTVRTVKDGAASVAGATKDAVVNGVDAARGFVAGHTPGTPSMNQYVDQQMAMQGQYPTQQGQGMSLSDFSPFTGFKNMLNTVTGGNLAGWVRLPL